MDSDRNGETSRLVEEAIQSKYRDLGDEYQSIARRMPTFYRFLTQLLDDPQLPKEFRPFLVGTIGVLCLPSRILPDADKNVLGLGYLVASVTRQLSTQTNNEKLIERNWPETSTVPRDVLSEVIREGNDELQKHEIRKVFRYAGFETRE
jgi:hypothetical protein